MRCKNLIHNVKISCTLLVKPRAPDCVCCWINQTQCSPSSSQSVGKTNRKYNVCTKLSKHSSNTKAGQLEKVYKKLQ